MVRSTVPVVDHDDLPGEVPVLDPSAKRIVEVSGVECTNWGLACPGACLILQAWQFSWQAACRW